jgi:general secretion pathway protein G
MSEERPIQNHYSQRPGFSPSPATLFRWIIMYPLLGLVGCFSLWAVLVPRSGIYTEADRRRTGNSDLYNFRTALEAFRLDTGRYPTTAEGLDALVTQPTGLAGWIGPYVEQILPDKWGTPYRYVCPATTSTKPFELSSAGPDHTFGTPDDLTLDSHP